MSSVKWKLINKKSIVRMLIGTLILWYGLQRLQGWRESGAKNAGLLAAVRADDQTGVLYALDNGASSDTVDSKRCSALMLAAGRGDIDIARALLDSGANANRRDIHGTTALMQAVTSGNPSLVALLIFWKVDVNARSDDGTTALKLAHRIAAGTTPEGTIPIIPNNTIQMPLSPAKRRQLSQIVQMLQQAGGRE